MPPQPRPVRGRNSLRSAATHLRYEWDMARAAWRELVQASASRKPVLTNIFLEDFLLHARNLRDFFAPHGKRDDVLAADFFGKPMRLALPLLRSAAVRNRLNKRIAHLTFARSRFRASWNVRTLSIELDQAMTRFAARLRAERPKIAKGIF